MQLEELLKLHGLNTEILDKLSYKSNLSCSLKTDLSKCDKTELISELKEVSEWLYTQENLSAISIDYRVKSFESILRKYDRYYPDREIRKVFNDILGLRDICDDYNEILSINDERVRIVDLSKGKKIDDGYRGVHLTYRRDVNYYPIEIQFNTFYDRQLNNFLHDYLYKKDYPIEIGGILRKKYEEGKIRNIEEFKEELNHVLCTSERCK